MHFCISCNEVSRFHLTAAFLPMIYGTDSLLLDGPQLIDIYSIVIVERQEKNTCFRLGCTCMLSCMLSG